MTYMAKHLTSGHWAILWYPSVNTSPSPHWQVQIQGEQGQTVGQVLQVASPTQQQLQGVTTTQLVQQGELTEEQQQQVMHTNR